MSGGPPPSHQPAAAGGDTTAEVQKIDDPRTYTVDAAAGLDEALPYRSNADAAPPPPVAEEVKAERFDADPLNATAYVEENPLHQLGAAMPFKSSSDDSGVDSARASSGGAPSSSVRKRCVRAARPYVPDLNRPGHPATKL